MTSEIQKHIPVTGIPAHAKYYEFDEKAWHKGFVIRNQTTIRFRSHHLELLQQIAKTVPLHTSRKVDLSRWKFGHAGALVRTLARVQLRNQLVECNADPAFFQEIKPENKAEVFMSCFQSAKRCEVTLNHDRLRDTMLDVLITPLDILTDVLNKDAEFCSDKERTLTSWEKNLCPFGSIGCEGDLNTLRM